MQIYLPWKVTLIYHACTCIGKLGLVVYVIVCYCDKIVMHEP